MRADTTDFLGFRSDLSTVKKVVLMIDMVESVLHMERDELAAVTCWHQFSGEAATVIADAGGHVVKSLGDGLMAVFDDALQAVVTAQMLHASCTRLGPAPSAVCPLQLRIGINAAMVYVGQSDIYGKGVNLTARLITLAGPGETIVGATVREQITGELGVQFEDLGECYLKHLPNPVRAFRLGVVGLSPEAGTSMRDSDLRPGIEVRPLRPRSAEASCISTGELIADSLLVRLSQIPDIRVIPHASTGLAPSSVASYSLSGSYFVQGQKLIVMAELADLRKRELIWVDRLMVPIEHVLELQSQWVSTLVAAAIRALIKAQVTALRVNPLPQLPSCTVLLGGVALMQKSSKAEFNLSRRALEAVIERHNQMATPHVWLALWHAMKASRGWSDNPERDHESALDHIRIALDLEPHHALARSIGARLQHWTGDEVESWYPLLGASG